MEERHALNNDEEEVKAIDCIAVQRDIVTMKHYEAIGIPQEDQLRTLCEGRK